MTAIPSSAASVRSFFNARRTDVLLFDVGALRQELAHGVDHDDARSVLFDHGANRIDLRDIEIVTGGAKTRREISARCDQPRAIVSSLSSSPVISSTVTGSLGVVESCRGIPCEAMAAM